MKTIITICLIIISISSIRANNNQWQASENHMIISVDSLRKQYDRIWQLTPNTYRVMKASKIGVADSTGAIIIPLEFNQIWDVDNNLNIKVLYNGKMGIYNLNGRIVIPAEYDNIWPFINGRAKVISAGKIGYYNEDGRMIIPCEYQQIWDFENGRAKMLKDGLMGYINENGLEIVPPLYQQIWDSQNGMARVIKNGKIGFINHAGIEVIPPVYTQIWDFHEGKAKAILDGKIIWIDATGQQIAQALGEQDTTTLRSIEETEELIEETNQQLEETKINIFNNRIEIVKDKLTNSMLIQTERKAKKEKFKGHYFGVDIGYNSFVTSGFDFSLPAEYQYLDLNDGKSISVAINVLQFNIGVNKNKNMGFVTGLGLEYNNYRFDSQNILTKAENGQIGSYLSDKEVKKNKLTSSFLNVPFLFEYQLNIPSTSAHAYFSAGPIMGLRLQSHTKVQYYNSSSKDKKRSNFCLNDFRYGLMIRTGYKAINLTASYYLSPLFDDGKGPELYPVSFSVGVSLNL